MANLSNFPNIKEFLIYNTDLDLDTCNMVDVRECLIAELDINPEWSLKYIENRMTAILELSPSDLHRAFDDIGSDSDIRIECDEPWEVRLIASDDIDRIMQEELACDEYVLGCSADWFLADVLDLDIDVIQALQFSRSFEAIGKMIISQGKLEYFQKECVKYDGYGIHFSGYDHSEDTIMIDGNEYYVFHV